MSEVKISAELRTEFGKGGARRTRRAGKVPAVLYGHGEPPRHIALPDREFAAAIRHGGMTQVFTITLSDGTETLALPKAIQRHPLKDTFEHVDLIIVRRGERVTVDAPIHVIGEAAKGTLVMVSHDRVAITAEAMHLPDRIDVSVDGLDAGSHVTAAALRLPEGMSLAADPDLVLVVVAAAPSAEELEGAAAAEEAEEGAEQIGAEPGADAPEGA